MINKIKSTYTDDNIILSISCKKDLKSIDNLEEIINQFREDVLSFTDYKVDK